MDVILMNLGIIGAFLKKKKKVIGYILNKNEHGIGIIPIEEKDFVNYQKAIFLKNSDIAKVIVKGDTMGRHIKIKMKDKTKYGFKTTKKIKNAKYHEENLKKFILSVKGGFLGD